MLVQCGMLQGVLLLQGFVVSVGRMAVTRFVVRALNLAQAKFQRWAPTTLALVPTIHGHDADDDGPLTEVGPEATPKGVPLARLVRGSRDLQYPVP